MTAFPKRTLDLAAAVIARCAARGWLVATAESCTGGLVAAALTEIAGSSVAVDRGFVTYSNEAKIALLGVGADVIQARGAVSSEVAAAMALGALARSGAHTAVSVTGVAGPGGGSIEKPVGTVWFGLARRDAPVATRRVLFPNNGRTAIRAASVDVALEWLSEAARV